jgi:hypothetical protein
VVGIFASLGAVWVAGRLHLHGAPGKP